MQISNSNRFAGCLQKKSNIRPTVHTAQSDLFNARRGTRGNAVPVDEKLPERMGKAFPLSKCSRTHYGRHREPFSGQKCTRLQAFAYTITKFFSGVNHRIPTTAPRRCLDPDTDFRLNARLSSVATVPVLRNDH